MNLLKNYLTNIADLGEKEDYKDLHKIYNLNNKIKYSFNMKRILPIHIVTKKIEIINAIGFSFFIFIFTHPKISKKNSGNTLETLINHELIHFKQQVELLFIFHWLLYGFFYIKNRLTKYKSHDEAYMNNPFEREAFSNEDNLDYLKNRRFWNWIKYLQESK